MPWINNSSDRNTMLSALPAMAEKFSVLYESLFQQTHIASSTLEVCRLRLAQLHRSEVEWQREDVDIKIEQRRQLADWANSESFSAAERACLEFTEMYAMDAQSISDGQAEAVKLHYGDAGLVALVEALGIFDGMTRLSLLWQLPAAGDERLA